MITEQFQHASGITGSELLQGHEVRGAVCRGRPGNRTAVRTAIPMTAMTRISTTVIPETGELPATAANPMITPPRPVPSADPSTEESCIDAVAEPSWSAGAVSRTTRLIVE